MNLEPVSMFEIDFYKCLHLTCDFFMTQHFIAIWPLRDKSRSRFGYIKPSCGYFYSRVFDHSKYEVNLAKVNMAYERYVWNQNFKKYCQYEQEWVINERCSIGGSNIDYLYSLDKFRTGFRNYFLFTYFDNILSIYCR